MNQKSQYYNDKALQYSISGSRSQKILEILKDVKGKKILEIGCSTGYFGKRLKEMGNYVVGIDISKKAIAVAKKNLDLALVHDIESGKALKNKTKFDLIIISEVIEHLFRPEDALRKLIDNQLKSSGELLITTPNIVYFVNRIKFMLGIFRYEKKGMFDESHIHFFTNSSLEQMTKNLNLKLQVDNNVMISETFSFLWKRFPGLFSYQFVKLYKNSTLGRRNN